MKNDVKAPSDALSQKRAGGGRGTLFAVLAAFIITVLYFAVIYSCFDFIYEINDDVAMRNVAAGVITGTPDAHLIFIKYILGLVISGLYAVIPGFDWYGIFMAGVLLLCLMLVLYRGLSTGKGLLWKAGYIAAALLLITIVGLEHLVAFQWTVVAAFAGATGIFIFATCERDGGIKTAVEEGIAAALLVISMLIRTKVFYMCLPAAALVFWLKYGHVTRDGKFCPGLRHAAVPLALAVCLIAALGVEKYAYSSQEWQTFREYNSDRSALMDYYGIADYEEEPEFYDSIGLTPEEVEALQRYSLYLSDDDFYPDTMALLADHAREQEEELGTAARLKSGVKLVWRHLTDLQYAPLNILGYISAVVALILTFMRDRKSFAAVLAVNVCIGMVWMYLGYRGRIVDRVAMSLFLIQLMSMAGIIWQVMSESPDGKKGPKAAAAEFAAICAVLCILAGYKWNEVSADMAWRSPFNDEFIAINEYMAEHPDNVYFMTTFSIEIFTDNFAITRDFEFSNLLSVGGWHTFSPLENEKCEKLGITDAVSDIVGKDNVYVISLSSVTLGYMDRYFTSVYGDDYLGRELVDTASYGSSVFEVYKFCVEQE